MAVALLCQGGDSRRNGTDFPEKRLGEDVGTGTPRGGSRLVPLAQFPTAPFLPAEPPRLAPLGTNITISLFIHLFIHL